MNVAFPRNWRILRRDMIVKYKHPNRDSSIRRKRFSFRSLKDTWQLNELWDVELLFRICGCSEKCSQFLKKSKMGILSKHFFQGCGKFEGHNTHTHTHAHTLDGLRSLAGTMFRQKCLCRASFLWCS